MAWDDTMPLILRNVIGDVNAPQKYTDDRLNETIIAAAQLILFRVPLPTTYSIDIGNITVSPDPTNPTTKDDAFVNFTILKAACMLMNAEVRVYGQQAIAIRDGTSAIDLKRDLKALHDIANSFCKELDKSVVDYYHSRGIPGRIIVGPLPCVRFGDYPRDWRWL
jgi:hypothetical protein